MRTGVAAPIVRETIDPSALGENEVVHYSIPAIEATGSPVVQRASELASMKQQVCPGDVLISKLNPRKSRVVVVQQHGGLALLASPEFVALRPRLVDGNFLKYFLQAGSVTQALAAMVTSATRSHQRVDPSDVRDLQLPDISKPTQEKVVRVLDRETAEIDAFIADQEKLIELLIERRSATIAHSVARGTREQTRLRPSNTPHLGLIPEGWVVAGLNRWAEASAGAGFPHEYQGRIGEAFPFYKVNALGRADGDGVIRFREDTVSLQTAQQLRAKVFPAGTVVLAKIGAALLLGRVRALEVASCLDNNMLGLAPKRTVSAEFLRYNAQTVHFAPVTNPGAVPSLSESKFMSFPLAWPPLDEQLAIVAYLRRETTEIDATIADAREAIALSKERRAALISAAVMGMIDVRGHGKASA